MQPFNLQRALTGAPVITRDGHRVISVQYSPNIQDSLIPLVVSVAWESEATLTYRCTANGRYYMNTESIYDLVMDDDEDDKQ